MHRRVVRSTRRRSEQQELFPSRQPNREAAARSCGKTVVVSEVTCSSVLNRSGIPGVDFAVNPYVGCTHGCIYCYAVFMRKCARHDETWGSFLDVKINAPEVLARQLARVRRGTVTIGTVTDPYQPAELHYGITRRCLRALGPSGFPVSILTKSDLVLRDIDVLQTITGVEVGLTITTLDDLMRARFEPHASPVRARLNALREAAQAGIKTWAFCGPLLPFLWDTPDQIGRLLSTIAEAGASFVVVDSLNLKGPIWGSVRAVIQQHYPELTARYQELARNRRPYHQALMTRARALAARYGLTCRN